MRGWVDRSEITSTVYGDPKRRRRSSPENKIVAHGRCDVTELELFDDIANRRPRISDANVRFGS